MKKNKEHLHQNVCVVSYLSNNGKMCLQKNNIFFFLFSKSVKVLRVSNSNIKVRDKKSITRIKRGGAKTLPNQNIKFFKCFF